MDVLDSPLNSAHQKGRLADSCAKSGKLDKAIEYHNEACEFLNIALQIKLQATVTNSIILQRTYHQKCIKILELKKKEIGNIIKAKQNIVSEKLNNHVKKIENEIPDHVDNSQNFAQFPSEISKSLDCDSLLQCLRHRSLDQGKPFEPCFKTKVKDFSLSKHSNSQLVIEELATKNEALCFHIQELLKEITEKDLRNNELEHENKLLKRQLEQKKTPFTEHTEMEMISNHNGVSFGTLPNLDLPPLEMPEFDFSV